MNFIPLSISALESPSPFIIIGAMAGVAFWIIGVVLLSTAKKTEAPGWVFTIIGMLLVVAAAVPALSWLGQLDDAQETRDTQITVAFARSYGWMPTADQVRELDYPSTAPEKGTPKPFGHTVAKVDGKRVLIQLSWDGEKLRLNDMVADRELNRAR